MQAFSLMYHDVVEAGADDASGFPGPWAAYYKLPVADFSYHLDAVRAAVGEQRVGLIEEADWTRPPVFLTYDDGGVSALAAAGEMEKRGMRGHFFVTTGRLGTAGFLNAGQVQELRRRGHGIGSHSVTHPTRMAACSREQLRAEWEGSVGRLEEILGEPVRVASVPGGYYSKVVGETAAAAGIRYLFHSEPRSAVGEVDGCRLLGRYAIDRSVPAAVAGKLARGGLAVRWKQTAWWEMKKGAKAVGGPVYLRLAGWFRNLSKQASSSDIK